MDANATFYKYLSDQLAYNSRYNYEIEDILQDAFTEIDRYVRTSGSTHASSGDFSPHKVKKTINDLKTYPITTDRIEISVLQLDATKALQFHIEFYYGDINDYYQTQGIKVKQEFADLSARVGYTIDAGNIE